MDFEVIPARGDDWAPPAGDGGGYDRGYDRGYEGNRWHRTGNSKGWQNRWNGGE